MYSPIQTKPKRIRDEKLTSRLGERPRVERGFVVYSSSRNSTNIHALEFTQGGSCRLHPVRFSMCFSGWCEPFVSHRLRRMLGSDGGSVLMLRAFYGGVFTFSRGVLHTAFGARASGRGKFVCCQVKGRPLDRFALAFYTNRGRTAGCSA